VTGIAYTVVMLLARLGSPQGRLSGMTASLKPPLADFGKTRRVQQGIVRVTEGIGLRC
jgi:hypothetical protein